VILREGETELPSLRQFIGYNVDLEDAIDLSGFMNIKLLLPLSALWIAGSAISAEVDFSRDVRPILSDNCFACHGFDEGGRAAGLRLDQFDGATEDLGGYAAIVPGRPDESELIARITSDDEDAVMPPPDSHKKRLDPQSIALLRRWIAAGAPWGQHWAFQTPTKSPTRTDAHPIDDLVRHKLATKNLDLAPRAATQTLARRLSFDLTGLPPTDAMIGELGENPRQQDWQRYIDGLIRSPHFGERMAMWWLDGARYSDTDGYQQDAVRTNWPWRDWVVGAFNTNMPFDQFTIQQFAGDLLPDATPQQILATCFHRNHMNNGEGGRDPAESRVDYVIDRVNTTGKLWLGLTLECTQCHDHKFDPISQRDYYSVAAYFDSIDETGAAGSKAGPYLRFKSPYGDRALEEAANILQQSQDSLEKVQQTAQEDADRWITEQWRRVASGFEPWVPIVPMRLETKEGTRLSDNEGVILADPADSPQDDYIVTAPPIRLDRITSVRLDVFPDPAHTDGKYSHNDSGEFILTNIKLQVRTRGTSQIRDIGLDSAVADVNGTGLDTKYANVSGTLDDDPRTGWTTRTQPSDVTHHAVFALAEPLLLQPDEELDIILMQRSLEPHALIGRFRLSVTDQAGEAVRSIAEMPLQQLAKFVQDETDSDEVEPAGLPHELRQRLVAQYLADLPAYQQAKDRHDEISRQHGEIKKGAGELNVMVLKQRSEPRSTHVLQRGVWDQLGEAVSAGVLPAVLPRDRSEVPTRLELGRWIVSTQNPLTARVIVNQIWQLFFGAGLVRTPGDFGLQGESPTHPEVLDWLAVDFMESGWDVQHLVRTIVQSETYRQSSHVYPELVRQDPENRWLARGARFRLPSWMIRDAALATSGLLNRAIGGPPVYPYQPIGVWKDQFMGRFEYKPSIGPAQYRRTLYAFWRRSSAPTFLFDTAMRRSCEVVQRRTNTPLHALTLLNDTTALQAARSLALQSLSAVSPDKGPASKRDTEIRDRRLAWMFHRVLSRDPMDAELSVLREKFELAFGYYADQREAAATLLDVGQSQSPPDCDVADLAANMVIANLLLNLDEAITHE
jgi:hypothetical protein